MKKYMHYLNRCEIPTKNEYNVPVSPFNTYSLVNIALNSKHRKSFLIYQKFQRIPRLNKCRINLHNCLIFQLGYWYWLFNHAWVRIYVLIAYFDGEVNKLTLNQRKETIETDWFNNTLIVSCEQQLSFTLAVGVNLLSYKNVWHRHAQHSISIESPLFRILPRSRASQTD